MQRYNELFSFLLVVKRVQMELHAAWNAQTQFGRLPASERAVLMPLWRLRAHMAFLVDNLQYYLQVNQLPHFLARCLRHRARAWSSLSFAMEAPEVADEMCCTAGGCARSAVASIHSGGDSMPRLREAECRAREVHRSDADPVLPARWLCLCGASPSKHAKSMPHSNFVSVVHLIFLSRDSAHKFCSASLLVM